MRVCALLLLLAVSVWALPDKPKARAATKCDPAKCKLPDCLCSSTEIPGGLKREETPQFVLLTFDDAVTVLNIEYYRKALYNKTNPNGCQVSATYFVSHDYTDHSLVHELHANGMEIALHSITHESLTTYWMEATVDTLTKEFAEQRDLMNKFANIPKEDMKSIRMPFLQMAGNNQFQMLKSNNFLYDLSWITEKYIEPGMWPYTTEYQSSQDCIIGPCPDESYSNVWVIPMINWKDESETICAMVDACVEIPDNADGIGKWMIREFNKQYKGNRAPFGFYVHSAWFTANEIHFDAYIKFIDYLRSLPDVFMVSGSQVIDWVKNPIKVSEMTPANSKCPSSYTPNCVPKECMLLKEGKEERWMTSCATSCPKSYPWLGNPLGNQEY